MKTLKIGQKVMIGKRHYRVARGIYMSLIDSKDNDIIFEDLGITNKNQFIEDIIGYDVSEYAIFPPVNSLKDLTKVVEKLISMSNPTNIITAKQFRKALSKVEICSTWNDRLVKELGNQLLFHGKAIVSDELIKDMYADANDEQTALLDELFPDYAGSDIISAQDLKTGEVMLVKSTTPSNDGAWLMRTYDEFVNLKNPKNTWNDDCSLEGTKIKITIGHEFDDGNVELITR